MARIGLEMVGLEERIVNRLGVIRMKGSMGGVKMIRGSTKW